MRRADLKVGPYERRAFRVPDAPTRPRLLEKDAGALDLLAAERAEEARDQPVHQLEIRGKRRRALVRVVEHLFPEVLGVHHGPGAAVDEDELRLQDVLL